MIRFACVLQRVEECSGDVTRAVSRAEAAEAAAARLEAAQTGQSASEALLRRLDNERQYLRR